MGDKLDATILQLADRYADHCVRLNHLQVLGIIFFVFAVYDLNYTIWVVGQEEAVLVQVIFINATFK